jgi:hypothetical protein
MNRYDIINELIKKCDYKTYLEIGVRNPDECFNLINCEIKHSVDPGYEDTENRVDYPYTSDNFFALLENQELNLSATHKWDIIFIDGLHVSSQVEKDILNSLNHLSENGVIVLHDCNPPELWFAREDYVVDGVYHPWNGTVWKAIYKLLCSRSDLDVFTVNTDEGLGIIKRGTGRKLKEHTNSFYEYKVLQNNLNEHLNCISVDDFIRLIG